MQEFDPDSEYSEADLAMSRLSTWFDLCAMRDEADRLADEVFLEEIGVVLP